MINGSRTEWVFQAAVESLDNVRLSTPFPRTRSGAELAKSEEAWVSNHRLKCSVSPTALALYSKSL